MTEEFIRQLETSFKNFFADLETSFKNFFADLKKKFIFIPKAKLGENKK